MGGLCSKSAKGDRVLDKIDGRQENHKSGGKTYKGTVPSDLAAELQVRDKNNEEHGAANTGNSPDDFYDGIPRFDDSFPHKSRSVRRQAAVAKVSKVGSRLGRAGIGKAVDVLDTLGSSMTNLNAGSGFVSGAATKGNEITILAFEVANTIVKGSNLMESLSSESIKHLKEEVLPLEAVQDLVSKDTDELLRIVAADKREELKVFSDELIRFGNRSKDPQWHNLDRYFEKVSRELNPQRQSREEAELVMQQLMNLVQYTAELYHELHALDRFEQDYQRKREEEDNSSATQGDSRSILRAEVKSQKKQVKHLKKKSLWSRSLEEVMEKLVDIVHFLHLEINNIFGSADLRKPLIGNMSNRQRLGPAGLSLHYANIVLQIDTLVARSSSMPANTRDSLYQSLPPNIKSALRSKLPSFYVVQELTVADIKNEMEKTLHWLVPVATNTAKAHHGFGWVGEWANTGSELKLNKKAAKLDIMRIETFHHADKDKVEKYILELLLWLQRLAIKSRVGIDAGEFRSTIKSIGTAPQKLNQQPTNADMPLLTIDEQNMLQDVNKRFRVRGISKSLDLDNVKTGLIDKTILIKSSSYSSTSRNKESSFNRICSKLPVIDFSIDKKRALDVIDRLDVAR